IFLILEPYLCLQCGRQYKTKTGFLYHVRVECGKPPEFCCSMCNKKFKHKMSYQRHMILLHRIILLPSYQCPNCYRLYTYSRGLSRHIKYECGVEWKFPCVMCNRPFKHLSLSLCTPSEWRPYVCDKPGCGRGYKYKSGLFRHVKYECGKEPQFQFSQMNFFIFEKKIKFFISIYKYILICMCFLGPQIKLKLKENFPKFMECPNGCGYTYTVISNYEEHMQKYCTKNKYYTCLYCNASFHLNEQLKKHLLMIHKCF
ncbi:zinc finger protein 11-like, partial [Myzus persicae]|uniref:zinc finger protein 11-like n=1 Tax=Myzus persicae TaxID=13164 RepID=UPI000B93433E